MAAPVRRQLSRICRALFDWPTTLSNRLGYTVTQLGSHTGFAGCNSTGGTAYFLVVLSRRRDSPTSGMVASGSWNPPVHPRPQ